MIMNIPAWKESTVSEEVSSRLADRIYERVIEQIVVGEFPIGERLPSENQLGTEHGVSRAVVREALAQLRADGVAITRPGRGHLTYGVNRAGSSFGWRQLGALPTWCAPLSSAWH